MAIGEKENPIKGCPSKGTVRVGASVGLWFKGLSKTGLGDQCSRMNTNRHPKKAPCLRQARTSELRGRSPDR